MNPEKISEELYICHDCGRRGTVVEKYKKDKEGNNKLASWTRTWSEISPKPSGNTQP